MSKTTSLSLSHRILFLNTLAFTVCFACWTLNGVLVTFLVDNRIYKWYGVQAGWLLGNPISTGLTMRLPIDMWVYLVLVILIGISWGIDKAAVYKHIPEYFPTEVGVVGGMVGMIGGLGGFFGPIIFGYLLTATRVWSSSWIFILLLSAICLIWMHMTITKMMNEKQQILSKDMDRK